MLMPVLDVMSCNGNINYVQTQVEKLLQQPAKFKFNFFYPVESEGEDHEEPICDWTQNDMNVAYPDIFDPTPLLYGTTQVVLVIDDEIKITSEKYLFDPTWKDILLQINELIDEEKYKNVVFYYMHKVGVTPDNTGYIIEVTTYNPN